MISNPFSRMDRRAPELKDLQSWINSEPLKLIDLKGKIILLDFWTYSCINCLRTLPHLKEMYKRYSSKGLVIIGIHTPEFDFEHDLENVKKAVKKHSLLYSIALDNNHTTWDLYGNRYWPRSTLIDAKGNVRMEHVGEGGYDEIEDKIIELLTEIGFSMKDKVLQPYGAKYEVGTTPETYCGSLRNEGIGNIASDNFYEDKRDHVKDIIFLQGHWQQYPQSLHHFTDKEGYILLKYSASEVNVVLKPYFEGEFKVEIMLDGKPLSKEDAGKDIKFEKNRSFVVVDHADMYNIVNSKKFGTHELKLVTNSKDFSIYAYTFG